MYNTDELNLDTLHEECGVCGIYGGDDAASLTALGLHALQHRGQEAAGIITYDQDTFHKHHDTGHVGDIFNDSKIIDDLPGNISIGHVRYSTAGSKNSFACQPIFAELDHIKLLDFVATVQENNIKFAGAIKLALPRIDNSPPFALLLTYKGPRDLFPNPLTEPLPPPKNLL